MEIKLTVTRRKFVAEDKREVEFYSFEADIGGEKITFQPRKEDKRLLTHLLAAYDLPFEE